VGRPPAYGSGSSTCCGRWRRTRAGRRAHLLDSTIVRARVQAAGARRKAGEQALGRSRGGFSTIERKALDPVAQQRRPNGLRGLHLRCDGHGRPVAFHLTGGERHDLLGAEPLFEGGALRTGRRGRPRWKPAAVIADKAYSAAWLLDAFRRKRIVPIIPSRADQPENPDFDRQRYRRRNLVERLVGRIKQFRRVATRYDKLATHYLAFVQLASVVAWLRTFGDTA
jgi:transposase